MYMNRKTFLAALLLLALGLLLRVRLPGADAQLRFREAVSALGRLAGGQSEAIRTVMRQLP